MRLSKPLAEIAPEAYRALLSWQGIVDESGLEPELLQLVALRASQLNGCAFCCDYHSEAARKLGTTAQRLACLAAWRDAPIYSPRERAAFAWCESVTLLAGRPVEDHVFAALKATFDERESVLLTHAVALINAWNRLSVPFQTPPAKR